VYASIVLAVVAENLLGPVSRLLAKTFAPRDPRYSPSQVAWYSPALHFRGADWGGIRCGAALLAHCKWTDDRATFDRAGATRCPGCREALETADPEAWS
jgi:hypothetical protein